MACPAEISLLHHRSPVQHHWWLADGGSPQQIAGLLGAPLRRTARRASSYEELLSVFAPLPAANGQPTSYRYMIQLRRQGTNVCCWRHYPKGIGWQRRCGPMPLELFVRRFSAGTSSLDDRAPATLNAVGGHRRRPEPAPAASWPDPP